MTERTYFRAPGMDGDGSHPGCDVVGRHHHAGEWKRYWAGLTERERESLKEMARRHQRSLSDVAHYFGAEADSGRPTT